MTRSLPLLFSSCSFLFLLLLLPTFRLISTIDAACTCTPSPSPPSCPSECSACRVSGSIQSNCNCDPGCNKGCDVGYRPVSEGGCGFLWLFPKTRCYRTDTYSTYECTECPIGKYGNECQNTCPGTSGSTVCSGNGWCASGVSGTGLCQCKNDAAGPACQYTRATTCSGRGTPQYNGACICDKGYTGTNCENCDTNYYKVNGQCTYCAAAITCSGNGVCQSGTIDSNVCFCNNVTTGFACQYTRETTCSGHGIPTYTGTCTCDAGYTGTKCENYCDDAVTCSGYGTCQPDATCKCKDGFYGSDCRACVSNEYTWPTCM